MTKNRFSSYARSPDLPASTALSVTPDDAADLPEVTLAINVAAPGTVRVTTQEGDVVDVAIAAGVAFPLRVSRIWATGTTATGISALY